MKLTSNAHTANWDINYAELLGHHDVVFRAPMHDPICGLPIGNGDSGCLLWTDPDRLHIAFNKTDLWDAAKTDDTVFCSMEPENLTVCRHGAHLTLDFGCPAFEMLYQNHFEERIALYDATASIHTDTPFCKTDITAFSSEAADVSVIRANVDFNEAMPLSLALQRFGSRSLFFWYSNYQPGTHYGLDGTSSDCADGIMKMIQKLNGTTFCVAVLPVCESAQELTTAGSHTTRASFAGEKQHRITFYLAIATGDDETDAAKNAAALVRNAAAQGYDALYAEHASRWAEFWSKSFVSLPQKNDYQENLWYLNLYYANSEMKGKSPAHFCNGLWSFYYDFVPWNHFFHYNMQLATFPLEAANHPELLETYYNFRFKQLPMAQKYAAERKHASGAFYADVCDGFGRNDHSVSDNCTCGAQLAMMLYRHYLFSGDRTYLEEKALPMMLACGEFYLDLLKLGEDSYYHVLGTQGYEGSPLLDDSITDYAMIRALFGALINELPEAEAEPYRVRLEHLAPYHYADMFDDEIEDGIFTHGIGKGTKAACDKVLAVGRHHGTDDWIRKTYGNPEHDYYGFPDTEMAPLYPSGLIGLKDRGSEIFNAIQNSVSLHHPALMSDNLLGRDASDGTCMGWCMEPIYLARMGMSDLLAIDMENTISTWTSGYPQGFGYYTPTDHQSLTQRWDMYHVSKRGTDEKRHTPAWNFRHFDYETLPIIAAATNEMLLQSYDGIVRLFCAVLPTEQYAFSLMAQGGYQVNAIYQTGAFDAWITAVRGGTLTLAFEQVTGSIRLTDGSGNPIHAEIRGDTYVIETMPGRVIHAYNADNLEYEHDYPRNTTAKVLGNAKLGEWEALD